MEDRMYLNAELLLLAARLGQIFSARVTSWGRDKEGNEQVGGHSKSWHLWNRGANAVDMTTSELDPKSKPDKPIPDKRILELMANEARDCGFQAIVYKSHVHIEVPW